MSAKQTIVIKRARIKKGKPSKPKNNKSKRCPTCGRYI